MSINVEYNASEINKIVVTNTLRMLERRGNIKDWEKVLSKLGDDFSSKSIYTIELEDKTSLSINLVSMKLTSIVQKTPLDDYLSNNVDVHKIVVCKDVAKKVVKQIVTEYSNAEFFFESEMLEDLPSKTFIPEHILLNKEEKAELLSKFTELELAKLLVTDRMARYYYAKIGDIFRIIRPSITSGKNVFYRRVVNGSWDILFES
jgi:DNA-directed RNA polymerase subunit H (RpoH/RPB5)